MAQYASVDVLLDEARLMAAYRPCRVAFALLLMLAIGRAHATSVLMISVDGMKPEYALQADSRKLKLPFLYSMIADGAYARGVVGVWPTVTYPSHTTLITGVTPAEHGIYDNLEFDPKRKFAESWFWYARQIKVPTLWEAAHRAGLTTASVGWPVSVGSPDVDFLIPEYWRIFHPTEDLNPSDRHLIAALSKPAGMLEKMQRSLGPYLMGNDVSLEADEIKTRFAVDILRSHKPRFMTVHLSSLDEAEHDHGPFSLEANQNLEAIDGMLSRLAAATRTNDPAAIVIVVSDHGFVSLTHRVNLYIPFIQAGLLDATIDPKNQTPLVKSWQAQPWLASGMAAIMLRDPRDEQTAAKVRELLNNLKSDPNNGIEEVLDRDAIGKRGAFPGASFLVVMKPSYYTGNSLSGEVVTDMLGHGGHGFSPDDPSMRAAFFIDGKGIAPHHELGIIDMRQIAPTVAQLLDLRMPSATATPLPVRQ
jgi:predicted AlkP superfamily pyrophosphatase or phosphodiesterase